MISALAAAAEAGAEHAQIGERVAVLGTDPQRLPAAHRKPGQCPVVGVGDYAIVRFDVGDDIREQVLLEAGARPFAARRGWAMDCPAGS